MRVFFISDLHLDPNRPVITNLFFKFLENDAKHASALYILGDFFEVFVGSDTTLNAHDATVMQALSDYAAHIPTYFMVGNRDFLISSQFLKRYNLIPLADPHVMELYGKKLVLMHGDTLCSKDSEYLRYRQFVRHPLIQWLYLKLPLTWRQKIAEGLRKNSIKSKQKPERKMNLYDVTLADVQAVFQKYRMDILIHGHTHKPEMQSLSYSTGTSEHNDLTSQGLKIVLGDWNEKASIILEFTPEGPVLKQV